MLKRIRNYFLPHEDNNHCPHIWQLHGTVLFVAIIIIIEVFFFAGSYLIKNKTSFLASVFPNALVAFTNDVRSNSNIPVLKENDLLKKAAELKAKDMATRGYFSHNTPEGNRPWVFLDEVGYNYDHAGENLAINFVDSKDVVDAWVKSPTHYANIIKETYSEIGIATAEGKYEGRNTIFIVEFFGHPKKAEVNTDTQITSKTINKVVKVNNEVTPEEILVASSTESAPKVFGETTDISNTNSKDKNIERVLTYPRHIVQILLSLIGIFVTAILALSIRRHNTSHHLNMFQIALSFVVIISLILILNSFFAAGSI